MTGTTIYIDRDGQELELDITGSVIPYVPARLYGHPDTWCPEEGGEVEIETITLAGKPWNGKLTKDEQREAEEALQRAARDRNERDAEDAAEARADRYYDD
jgi:hypothetical protein